ncbi:MAG: PAS domain S-box protein [Deltaproteobacteria bacterium]|nr:PAS domain S-box protein [Deltaproteobacteria bacterium]
MDKRDERAGLEAEIGRLKSEIETAKQRGRDLEETRKAMLFLLEDTNEGTALLAKAKKDWEAAFDSISDMLFIHDREMRIIRCNRAYKEAAGLPFKEIIGRPYYEVFPKMEGPFLACTKTIKLQGKQEEEEIVTLPSLNKTYKVKFFSIQEEGENSFVHVIEDITVEKMAEEALKASEDKYRHLFENLNDAAFLADLNGWIIETNKKGEELFGRPRAEIIGMHQSGFHPPDKEEEYRRRFAEHVKRGREADFDGEMVRNDGTVIPVTISGSKVNIGGKELMLGIFRDITEKKKAEEKIKEEMDLNKHLLMIANATAHTTDIDRLMAQVAGCLRSIMRCDISLSYICDRENKTLQPSQGAGLTQNMVPFFRVEAIDLKTPFVKKAFESKGPVAENLGPEPAGLSEKFGAYAAGVKPTPNPGVFKWVDGLKTVVVIPLIGKEDFLGLLACLYTGAERYSGGFSQRDREVMDGISFQVSTALDEARLYKESIDSAMELSRKVETIQTMHEIDTAILSTIQPQEILEIATRMVAKIVFCERATVALIDAERGGFTYAAGFGPAILKKGSFIPFGDTSATDVVKTGRPQYAANTKELKNLLPLEADFLKEGFVSHIRVPLVVKSEVIGILNIGAKRPSAFTPEDLNILEKLASQIGVALENSRLLSDLEGLFFGIVKTLSEAIDAKSPWTGGHSERVTKISMQIGRELGLKEEELKRLELSGLLHDIGKLGTYESILDKPGKLTEDEVGIIKLHPKKGADILSPIRQMRDIIPAIKHHHECFDGTGYPEGIKGEDIPLMARILTVADTVDAMGADRPYRKGRPMDEIIVELKRCSGTQFDPKMVDAFLRTIG